LIGSATAFTIAKIWGSYACKQWTCAAIHRIDTTVARSCCTVEYCSSFPLILLMLVMTTLLEIHWRVLISSSVPGWLTSSSCSSGGLKLRSGSTIVFRRDLYDLWTQRWARKYCFASNWRPCDLQALAPLGDLQAWP
jgi:hypothetical protein